MNIEKKIEQEIQVDISTIQSIPLLREMLERLSALRKAWEDYWKEPIQQAYKSWKSLNLKKKEIEDKLIVKMNEIKMRLKTLELERREQEKKMLEEAKAAQENGLESLADELSLQAMIASKEKAHTRTIWKWEVEDISKVPLEFLTVDTKKLNAHVRKYKDKKPIPGIRIFKEEIVTV